MQPRFGTPREDFRMAVVGWIVALLIVLLPGGVLTQVWTAKYRIAEKYAASPLGKLCYYCGRPATHSQAYTNGEVLYFCDRHKAPKEIWASYGKPMEHGNGYNPVVCTVVLALIYGGNILNVLMSLILRGREKYPSAHGAFLGIFAAVGFWFWFHSR